jgi:hypothetical protein
MITYAYRGEFGHPVIVSTSVEGAKARLRHIESGDFARTDMDPATRPRIVAAAEAEAAALRHALSHPR